MNINRTIIVPDTYAPLARALAAGMSAGGVGMFETPCAMSGAPCSVSSGQIDAAFDSFLPLEGSSQEVKDAAASALFAASKTIDPPILATLAQCQELVAASVMVDCGLESAEQTFVRLGIAIDAAI